MGKTGINTLTANDIRRLDDNVVFAAHYEVLIPQRRIVNVIQTNDFSIEEEEFFEAVNKALELSYDCEDGLQVYHEKELGLTIFVMVEDLNKLESNFIQLPKKLDPQIHHELMKMKEIEIDSEE